MNYDIAYSRLKLLIEKLTEIIPDEKALINELTDIFNDFPIPDDELLVTAKDIYKHAAIDNATVLGRAYLINKLPLTAIKTKADLAELIDKIMSMEDEEVIDKTLRITGGFYREAKFWLPF